MFSFDWYIIFRSNISYFLLSFGRVSFDVWVSLEIEKGISKGSLTSYTYIGKMRFTYVTITYLLHIYRKNEIYICKCYICKCCTCRCYTSEKCYYVCQNHHFHISNWVHPTVFDVFGFFGFFLQISQNAWRMKIWN